MSGPLQHSVDKVASSDSSVYLSELSLAVVLVIGKGSLVDATPRVLNLLALAMTEVILPLAFV